MYVTYEEHKNMRKLLAAVQFSLVFALAFAFATPKSGALSTFDPQPEPPAAFGWTNPGSYVSLNPQPLPPGGTVSLNPQPLPPRYFRFFGR
jgi:hypothetical protein